MLGGPLAALLHARTQSWIPMFEVMITMDLVTAVLAQLVSKSMRRRWIEQTNQVDSAQLRVS